jgi:predicted lipoprotein with Yx(FWY)xxD motif
MWKAFGRKAGLGSVLLVTGFLLVAGCSSSSKKAVATNGATTTTKLGSVLTDSSGLTLYTFASDTVGGTTSACTGACATAWPPLTTTGTPTAGPGVTGTLATISGGQVTWNGHPLYRWMGDHAPGDTTGDGVNGFHAALAGATTSTSTTRSGGAGY